MFSVKQHRPRPGTTIRDVFTPYFQRFDKTVDIYVDRERKVMIELGSTVHAAVEERQTIPAKYVVIPTYLAHTGS